VVSWEFAYRSEFGGSGPWWPSTYVICKTYFCQICLHVIDFTHYFYSWPSNIINVIQVG
jgi:hypothetical protein